MRTLLLGVLGLSGFLLAVVLLGRRRWAARTRVLHTRLDQLRSGEPQVVTSADDLPAPVARYLRSALAGLDSPIDLIHLAHEGTFNIDPVAERWRPFTSDQVITTRPPGFVWDGRVRVLPGLAIHVHDAYVGGEGHLHASVLGWLTVARPPASSGLAEGELMRFLAEAVWYPSLLLPGGPVRWEAIDDASARATLHDGDVSASLVFRFGPDGLVAGVEAAARDRTVGTEQVPTPWQGRFWDYRRLERILIPLEGEVSWLLPTGPLPYWRGRICGYTVSTDVPSVSPTT